jgi:hypothetical protein
MAGDESLKLWLHQYKLKALERVLKESGTDVQTVMQARLEELYRQYVSAQERTDINNTIEGERLAAERQAEANDTFAVFRVHENGSKEYYRTKLFSDLLGTARALRRHLRDEGDAHITFADRFTDRKPITPDDFERYVMERMDNTGRIVGAFDIDFDKREFSGVHIMDGWQTYSMHDVSTAIYHADRSPYAHPTERLEILLDKLDGKQITSAGHLSARELSFEDEICEMDERLDFMLDGGFDVDAVFGTFVVTDQNDDWLNIYANYDMPSGEVCDTLDIVLHRGDGTDEELSYTLNSAEKEILLRKMDDYCQKRNGMTLTEYSAQRMAENDAPLMEQMQEPTM